MESLLAPVCTRACAKCAKPFPFFSAHTRKLRQNPEAASNEVTGNVITDTQKVDKHLPNIVIDRWNHFLWALELERVRSARKQFTFFQLTHAEKNLKRRELQSRENAITDTQKVDKDLSKIMIDRWNHFFRAFALGHVRNEGKPFPFFSAHTRKLRQNPG